MYFVYLFPFFVAIKNISCFILLGGGASDITVKLLLCIWPSYWHSNYLGRTIRKRGHFCFRILLHIRYRFGFALAILIIIKSTFIMIIIDNWILLKKDEYSITILHFLYEYIPMDYGVNNAGAQNSKFLLVQYLSSR